jgi:lipoprotein NlpD
VLKQMTGCRLCCLSLFVISICYGCASTINAPVDSRIKVPANDTSASYSQGNVNISSKKQGDYHVVVKGDTLYSIAWRYGHDYRTLAKWNDISGNYLIYPGQFLRLKADTRKAIPLDTGPIISKKKINRTSSTKIDSSKRISTNRVSKNLGKPSSEKIKWGWPTKGKLVKLNTPTSKKGVDIAGRAGQKVNAAADGDVVYSGGGLLGYGKLIIIKHNETFLSAYAHNEKLLAKEGEKVKAGQQIATMGLGNKGQPILHFEIRKDGSPVNPLQHLPKSNS